MQHKLTSILNNSFLSLTIFLLFSVNVIAQPSDFPFQSPSGTDTIFQKNQIIVFNASKDTLEIAGFKSGKKNGKQTLFYNNGEIKRIANYKNDLLDGKVEYYSQKNKAPFRVENYKSFPKDQKSLLHGVYRSFGKDGELVEKTNYRNGVKNGNYELYHNNYQLKEKGIFENNLNVGRKRSYNAEGILMKDENYIVIDNPQYIDISSKPNDANFGKDEIGNQPKRLSVLDGKVKYYHYSGLLASDLKFENGKKVGLAKEYNPDKNHTLKSEVFFKDGLEHGPYVHYHSNGNLERKGIYYREIKVGDTLLKNVYDGTIEIYQDNGKRARIENWKFFKRNGVQENYSYQSGELSERTYAVDNLKSGSVERFNKDGSLNYLAYYEIVEKDGQKISQQTGTETYWEKGKIRTTTEWKNGLKEGSSKSYYENGQVESMMHFKNDKLHGSYKTYYENGQPKEDYNKQNLLGTGNSENIGWNTSFDEHGNVTRNFYATGTSKTLIAQYFENGKKTNLTANDVFRLGFFDGQQLTAVNWQNNGRPIFGYEFFSNNQLRKVHFTLDERGPLSANFTTEGNLIQVISNTGKIIDNDTVNKIAKKVALQYNPKWENEILATQPFPEGKYHWNYADGTPFFKIEFKDSLPQDKWIAYNPILQDTIFYAEFHKGLPVGKYIRKKIDGTPELRVEYYPNHEVKESYYYGDKGIISNIYKNDSTGTKEFYAEYYPNGRLKDKRLPTENSYINFSTKGDTLSYSLLFTKQDSIRIERQFFEGNQLKVDRYNNLTSGLGSVKTYFENGQLQTSHELKDTKPHGVYQKFNEKGSLLALGHFKEGKRVGKWINYENNGEEVSYFKDGEIVIEETKEDDDQCKCYDTSLAGGKIGFANSLKHFADYKSIKPFIPKTILPINDWHYDKIFYLNLRTNGDQSNGSTHFKLLLFNDFSFHYPATDYLKFNLNPCKTEGYIGNIEANISYNFDKNELRYSQLQTKRIAVSLEKNPLVNAKDKSAFTAYFNTDYMEFSADGIKSIQFSKEKNDCYPLGQINEFMTIEIESAQLDIDPKHKFATSNLPLLANEIKQFYGIEINTATIKFNIDSVQVEAICDQILAGANYVAGRLFIDGAPKNKDEFFLSDGKQSVNIQQLKKVLEQKGFYRVKVEVLDHRLVIEFYAEK